MEQRNRLETFFRDCGGHLSSDDFFAPWLNDIFPGLSQLPGCDQGSQIHLEGDVAVHTALVFRTLFPTSNFRLHRAPDFVEMIAAVLHDIRKPQTRQPGTDGSVKFPGHEALAAKEVPLLAEKLALSAGESQRLEFAVSRHGDTHRWPELSMDERRELKNSPHIFSLALLQEADAKSCLLPSGGHSPVYWLELTSA